MVEPSWAIVGCEHLWPLPTRCQQHHAPSFGTAQNASAIAKPPLRAESTLVEPTALGHQMKTTVCVFTTGTLPHLSPFGLKSQGAWLPKCLGYGSLFLSHSPYLTHLARGGLELLRLSDGFIKLRVLGSVAVEEALGQGK